MKLDTDGTVKSAPKNLTFSFYLKCLEHLSEALVTMQVIKSSRTTEVSSSQEVADISVKLQMGAKSSSTFMYHRIVGSRVVDMKDEGINKHSISCP